MHWQGLKKNIIFKVVIGQLSWTFLHVFFGEGSILGPIRTIT
jgi:hypothetical protein